MQSLRVNSHVYVECEGPVAPFGSPEAIARQFAPLELGMDDDTARRVELLCPATDLVVASGKLLAERRAAGLPYASFYSFDGAARLINDWLMSDLESAVARRRREVPVSLRAKQPSKPAFSELEMRG